MDKIKSIFIKHKQLIIYFIFGVLTTAVNWLIYTVLVSVLPESIGSGEKITVSNAAAWIGGVLFAFITNKIWVFESKSFAFYKTLKEFISFLGARALTGVLEVFAVPFLVEVGFDMALFGVQGSAAKITVSVAVVVLNYVFSKLIVFKKNKSI